ncbi:PRTRC system protein B [Deinococcus ruber]|nr:PRTRC system protein B [Deinococcus ruber]
MNIATMRTERLRAPTVTRPVLAFVLYEGDTVRACSHPVHTSPSGAVALGAAQALTTEQAEVVLEALGRRTLLPVMPHTLALSSFECAWWVPPGKQALHFDPKYDGTQGIAALNGTPIPHPGLVMVAGLGRLRVFAVQGREQPTLETPLCHAPFWNMFASGAMCQGSVVFPTSAHPQDQASWEAVFFRSTFTGPSRSDRYVQWDRSYQELLELAITDQMFPDAVLMPVGKTVGEVLRSV